MPNWPVLIAEHHTWEAYNFPDVTLFQDLMGVQEEIGELTHHYLKMSQGIRGSDSEHLLGMQDAIGDITIYLLGVMHNGDIDPASVLPHRSDTPETDRLILLMGCTFANMSGNFLGLYAGKTYALNRFLGSLIRFCDLMGFNYERIVHTTWSHVKTRDWQKDKLKGVTATPAIQGEHANG